MTTNYTLDKAELETVLDTVADDGEVAGVVALWELILDVDHLSQYDGSFFGYRIPTDQWKVICQAMMDNPQHDGMPGGTMLNSGPSSWEDDDLPLVPGITREEIRKWEEGQA